MERMKKAGITPRGCIDYHMDAASGWAAFEELVLESRRDIVAAFDGFDLGAPVLSPRACAIGPQWSDLIAHALERGRDIDIALGNGADPSEDIAAIEARVAGAARPGRIPGRLHLHAEPHPLRQSTRFGLHAAQAPAHHVNLAVVDDRALFLPRSGLSSVRTPGRSDLAIIARGTMVSEARQFLGSFGQITAGTMAPPPVRRLLRTLSSPAPGIARLFGTRTVANEIESAHHMLIRRAERLIHIETQCFDSPSLARHIATRAKAVPGIGMVLIVSGDRPPPPGQARCLAQLREAFGARIFIGAAPAGASNISIFDDQSGIVGSADLSRQALASDSHAALYLRQGDGLAALRQRLTLHWLGAAAPDPEESRDGLAPWHAVAARNLETGASGPGVLLPWSP